MKPRVLLLLCALGCAPGLVLLRADPPPATAQAAAEQVPLTSAQLERLLAPIALYPDPLIAIILPAATFPADLVIASRFLHSGGSPEAIEGQPWDDSVKALARYPEVLKWMDDNLVWTRRLGEAFAQQPADTLTATQRLRAAARAAGTLRDTPEQRIVLEQENVRILPAQAEFIHVPIYDPVHVYRPHTVHAHPTHGTVIRFTRGYRTGYWLSYHCNWTSRTVVVVHRTHRVSAWQHLPRWACPTPSVVYRHNVFHPTPAPGRAMKRDYDHRVTKAAPPPPAAPVNVLPLRPRDAVAEAPDRSLISPHALTPTTAPTPRPARPPALERPRFAPDSLPAGGQPARIETERTLAAPRRTPPGAPTPGPDVSAPTLAPAAPSAAAPHLPRPQPTLSRRDRIAAPGTAEAPAAEFLARPATPPAEGEPSVSRRGR